VVIGSPNVNPGYRLVGNQDYPQIAGDFVKTFAQLKKLPCDIFLADAIPPTFSKGSLFIRLDD
jgi:hypothetical protein